MTFPELIGRLEKLDARVEDRGGRPFLVLPPGAATPELAAEIGPALAEFRVEVQCHYHPGRVCVECGSMLFVDAARDVRLLCVRAMCPSFDPTLWPPWCEKDRWFETRRRSEAARIAAETIPD